MTQETQILDYLSDHNSITPAKMGGKIYNNKMFGSETSRACRKLRAEGKLISRREGKFEVFYLKDNNNEEFYEMFQELVKDMPYLDEDPQMKLL